MNSLAAVYDDLCNEQLEPLSQMANDAQRRRIDDAFSIVLGLPNISTLRRLLAQEPVVSNQKLEAVVPVGPSTDQLELF